MTRMRFLGVILSMYKLTNCAKIIPMIMKIRYSQKSLSGHNWCLLLKLAVDINPPPHTIFLGGNSSSYVLPPTFYMFYHFREIFQPTRKEGGGGRKGWPEYILMPGRWDCLVLFHDCPGTPWDRNQLPSPPPQYWGGNLETLFYFFFLLQHYIA